jgi:predicted DNA-binding transcriptional regulator AlpA
MFAVRWMVKHTGFRVFTAYSDVEARELGTIYQACNFIYLGQNSGGRYEYFDPDFPNSGWFSDRQFRQLSQIKRYARDLGISWKQEWSDGRAVDWARVPSDIEAVVRTQASQHKARCKKREVQPKHKYAYIVGATKTETKSLLARFRERHPDLQDIPYPKHRGHAVDAAAKDVTRPCQVLPENFESSRPAEESSQTKDDFLTVKETAQMMRVSDWSIYNMIKSDPKFPALNIGVKKKFVVDRVRLNEWLKNRSNERSA